MKMGTRAQPNNLICTRVPCTQTRENSPATYLSTVGGYLFDPCKLARSLDRWVLIGGGDPQQNIKSLEPAKNHRRIPNCSPIWYTVQWPKTRWRASWTTFVCCFDNSQLLGYDNKWDRYWKAYLFSFIYLCRTSKMESLCGMGDDFSTDCFWIPRWTQIHHVADLRLGLNARLVFSFIPLSKYFLILFIILNIIISAYYFYNY